MTVIYVDSLFLLNMIIDYLLLLAAGRLAGETLRRRQYFLAGLLGGLYAVLIFVPQFEFLNHPLCRGACGLLMVLIAYGSSTRLLRQSIIFLLLTFAFGGGVLAISMLGGDGLSLGHGVYYSPLDLKMVLLSGGICYLVITAAMGKMGAHTGSSGELIPVKVRLGDRTSNFMALLDTGNTLTDPILGCPVMVAEGTCLEKLFPFPVTGEAMADPVSALPRLQQEQGRGRFRLIPYQAVGVSRAMLLGVKMDEVILNGKAGSSLLVALSPSPVSDGGNYKALVNPAACR